MAIILALFGPWGVGHFYLGRRLRGAMWLFVAIAPMLVLAALVSRIGEAFGWGVAVALPIGAMFVAWVGSFVDLFRVKELAAPPRWQTALFFVLGMAAPVMASVVLRAWVVEAFIVPTRSMEPALLAGDRLVAARSDHRARYGDVIVFASPENGQTLIKRVIGRPHDVLEMKQGRPVINGWPVPSCPLGHVTLDDANGDLEVEFLGDASYLVFYDASAPVGHAGPLYAANDGVLVLGDDRNDSADSRAWHGGRDGNVHASAVRGRALFVWLRHNASDDAHVGIDLGHIALPSTLDRLAPEVAKCLAARPNATPPAPLTQR